MLNFFKHTTPSSEVLIRIAADAILVNLSLIAALLLHYVYETTFAMPLVSRGEALTTLFTSYLSTFIILTSVSINVLYISGFYSRGRHYQTRYKRQAALKAMTATQLIFALIVFFLWDTIGFPRSVLIPSWAFSVFALIAARTYTHRIPFLNRIAERVDASETSTSKFERVLVIGGGGYIGSALLAKLLNKGYQVRLLDLLLFGTEPIQDLIGHPNLEIVKADFRQVHSVIQAMRNVDAVIHLGAIVGDPACAYDEDLTIGTNLVATRMVAEIAQCAGIKRFIFASTCSVYGASDEILDEKSMLNPVSLYARSKIASEEVLTQMASDSFSPVFMRFGTIYGLSGRTRFDLVINLLTAKALLEREITIFGGDQWRPFVHVDDAAQAVFLALEAPTSVVHNRVFNVGSNEQNYTINQIGDLVQQMVPEAKVLQMGDDQDKRNYRVDFSRIHNELHFRPEWTVEKGVRQVQSAIESGKVTNYQDAQYNNFKYLKEGGIELLDEQSVDGRNGFVNSATVQLPYNMQFALNDNDWTTDLVAKPIKIALPQATASASA